MMPSKHDILDRLKSIILKNFHEITDTENDVSVTQQSCHTGFDTTFRISWKTNDDQSRPSKRINPIIVLISDEFMEDAIENTTPNVLSVISVGFESFIRDKRREYKPSAPNDVADDLIPVRWQFSMQL
jgi:hypothetical protein